MIRANNFSELMRQIRDGSETATQELLTNYGSCILRVVRRRLHRTMRSRFDSQDFVQAVWASFFAYLPEQNDFGQPEELVAYLTELAQNKVVEAVRVRLRSVKQNVNREREIEQSAIPFDARQLTPVEVAIAREEWQRLVARQPTLHRRILLLLRGGYSQGEIAHHLGLDERTIRRILRNLNKPKADEHAS